MDNQTKTRNSMFFIITTVLIDGIGIGLIIPVMPTLIQSLGSGSVSNAATWGGLLATVFALMQFIFGPIIGSLSDAYGRRPILLFSLVVTSLNYVLMGFASSLAVLFIARIIGGIASATAPTASAYMADISTPEEKTRRFGYIGAAYGSGFVFGPVLGGLLGEISPHAPFFAAAALATLNTIYGYFALPESVSKENRRPFSWKRGNPISAIASFAKVPFMRRVLIVLFIYSVAFNVFQSVWAYYGELQYDWTPQTLGISLAIFGVGIAVVQALLLKPILGWLGDRRTVLFAFGVDVIVFTTIAFITNGTVAIIVAPIATLGAMATPALQGIVSKRAGNNEQGVLQGVFTSMSSLAMIVAPLAMTQVFAIFSKPGTSYYFPGAPFILSAILLSICIVIVIRTKAPAVAPQPTQS